MNLQLKGLSYNKFVKQPKKDKRYYCVVLKYVYRYTIKMKGFSG